MARLIRRLTSAPVAMATIAAAGIAVYDSGLGNPFIGDDSFQIVKNPPVHSLANLVSFFQGGTFYVGQPILSGVYYRPFQTTAYSVIYAAFGANPAPFHAFQLVLCILSAIILYAFFRYSLRPGAALVLALVFLVHPVDSQVVFALPKLGDAMFFFFGITALWILVRFRSIVALIPAITCLFCSLLSKETGILFSVVALIYLYRWDRRRLAAFMGMVAPTIIAYLLLKAGATGWNNNPGNAPIDMVGLGGRLITLPSVILLYLGKLVWPAQLASGYYWVHPAVTLTDFVIPLVVDLAAASALAGTGWWVQRHSSRAVAHTFWFFAAWTLLGLAACSQVIPLDMTASEPWLYFPFAGLLGMIGIATRQLMERSTISYRVVAVAATLVVVLLGLRTALRGPEWSSAYELAQHDLATSPDNYQAEIAIAYPLMQQGRFADAVMHAQRAVKEFPTALSFNMLGLTLLENGEYARAQTALATAMSYQDTYFIEENLGLVTAFYGDPAANHAFLSRAVTTFPQDGKLWLYLAILDERTRNYAEAKVAIANAYSLGAASDITYTQIMRSEPLILPSRPGLDS